MFYPTGILLCSFLINPDSYKLFREKQVAFIDFFSNIFSHIGQMQVTICINCKQSFFL